MNNVACRIFKEQLDVILCLPELEQGKAIIAILKNAFGIENNNTELSVSAQSIVNLLKKTIVCKEFSSNYGGARTGAGRKSGNQFENQYETFIASCEKKAIGVRKRWETIKGIDNYTNVLDMNTNLVDKHSDDKDMIYIVKDKDKDKDKENNIGGVGEKRETIDDLLTIKPPKPKKKDFVPPTLEEWRSFCKELKLDPNRMESIYYGYSENDWRDSHGNQIKNWKMKIRQVWDKPENKDPEKPTVNFTELVELWNDMAARLKLQPVSESDLMPERKAEIEKIIATKKPKDLPTLVAQLEQVIKKSPKLLGRQDDIGVDGRWFTRELGWQASFAFCFSTKGWSDIMAGKYNGEMK